jgi:hypothetical protein
MSYKYASGQKAIAICDVCGFQYKLTELKELIVIRAIRLTSRHAPSVGTQISHRTN